MRVPDRTIGPGLYPIRVYNTTERDSKKLVISLKHAFLGEKSFYQHLSQGFILEDEKTPQVKDFCCPMKNMLMRSRNPPKEVQISEG